MRRRTLPVRQRHAGWLLFMDLSLLALAAGCGDNSTVSSDDSVESGSVRPRATGEAEGSADAAEICKVFVSMFVPGDPKSGALVEIDTARAARAYEQMVPLAPPDLRVDLEYLNAAQAEFAADPGARPPQEEVTAAYQADRRVQEWMAANCDLPGLLAERGFVPDGYAPPQSPSPGPDKFEPIEGSIDDL